MTLLQIPLQPSQKPTGGSNLQPLWTFQVFGAQNYQSYCGWLLLNPAISYITILGDVRIPSCIPPVFLSVSLSSVMSSLLAPHCPFCWMPTLVGYVILHPLVGLTTNEYVVFS